MAWNRIRSIRGQGMTRPYDHYEAAGWWNTPRTLTHPLDVTEKGASRGGYPTKLESCGHLFWSEVSAAADEAGHV